MHCWSIWLPGAVRSFSVPGKGALCLESATKFTAQHGLRLLFNLGHWFFSIPINVLLLQRLRNPVMASKKHRAGFVLTLLQQKIRISNRTIKA
jgi:hypothetical protein